MNNKLFYSILLLLCIALLAGCKSAEKLYSKAYTKDKATVAKLARQDFPCVTTEIIRDTVENTELVEVIAECPEFITPAGDTIFVTKKEFVPVKGRTITNIQKVEDSAAIYQFLNDIEVLTNKCSDEQDRLKKALKKSQAETEKEHKKTAKRNKWILILIAGVVVSNFGRIIKLLRP